MDKNFDFLGKAINQLPNSPAEAELDCFPNRHDTRDYVVEFNCVDFTSRCPVTQQSDFAHIIIRYVPDALCIETKSLKFYMQSYREQKMFNEQIINQILEDLSTACKPKWMQVKGSFASRGGISLTTIAEYPDLDINEMKRKLI